MVYTDLGELPSRRESCREFVKPLLESLRRSLFRCFRGDALLWSHGVEKPLFVAYEKTDFTDRAAVSVFERFATSKCLTRSSRRL